MPGNILDIKLDGMRKAVQDKNPGQIHDIKEHIKLIIRRIKKDSLATLYQIKVIIRMSSTV